MKESISYVFLLNIIIVFLFICAAVVGGIFSYYRAFKANWIIVQSIEKYEGYNCLAKEEIAIKLNNISYNVPSDVECDTSRYGSPCVVDDTKSYAVVAHNLDYSFRTINTDTNMDAHVGATIETTLSDGTKQYVNEYTHRYQFGVYTFMYIDLPVISSFLKLPVHSRTKELYEFRNLRNLELRDQDGAVKGSANVDLELIPKDILNSDIDPNEYTLEFSQRLLKNYVHRNVARSAYAYGYDPALYGYGFGNDDDYNAREAFRYLSDVRKSQKILSDGTQECGHVTDWSIF